MGKSEQRKQYWFVIRELTSREIKRKYSRSKLGVIWSVLNPLLFMLVISLVFSKMFSRSIENYPIYYLCGNIMWSLFTQSTNSAMTCLVDNKNMLIKVRLPMEIFILSRVYTAFVNFLYSLIAFVLMLAVFRITPHITLIFFPVIVLFMLMFALGISFILATAYVFFGDIKHLYSVLLTLWMYLSALFYPVSSLPDMLQEIIGYNPVFVYINALRNIVMYAAWPDGIEIIKMASFAVGIYIIGYIIFRSCKNRIMQKI